MAGVALRANCTEDDINELNKIVNGQYRECIKKRARCIILSSQGVLNKDIADEVDLTPRLVGGWVRRYNAEGISGLFDIPKPGRSGAKRANSDLGDRIREKIRETPPSGQDSWTAQALSKELGVSVFVIWRICHELDITLQRPRTWIYDTQDELSSKNIDVVGLFCTRQEKAIVIRINTENENTLLRGVFQTHSKDVANEIEQFRKENAQRRNSDAVSLADILAIATEHASDQRRYREMPLYEFLNDLIAELPGTPKSNYMIVSYSQSRDAFRGLGKAGYSFTSAHSNEDWLNRAETILKSQCNTSDEEMQLTRELDRYVNAMVDSTEPFIWWKRPVSGHEARIPEPSKEVPEPPIKPSPSNNETEAHSNIGKPKVEITFSYTDENGKVTAQTASVTEGLLHTNECDLGSTESIAGFVENLTSHTIPLLDMAAQRIGTFALEAVKKNSI